MIRTMTRPKINITLPKIFDVKWGDVIYVNFGDNVGSEQCGIRPALVVQNDKGNSHSSCTLVAPITSEEKAPLPTHILVYPTRASGLKETSTVMCEQIRVIDKSRIISKVGHLDAERLVKRIESCISIAFSKDIA